MEVKINKEIREYSESIFFGLNLRQLIFSLLAMGAAVTVYFLCKEPLGTQATSWLCILSAIPFALLGFVRYNGMNAEQLAVAWVASFIVYQGGRLLVAWVQSELLLPERFLYKGENLYYHIVMEEEN